MPSETQRLLHAVIDEAPAWVMVVREPDLVIEEANPQCERMFGGSLQGLTLPSLLAAGETELAGRIHEAHRRQSMLQVEDLPVSVSVEGLIERRHWSFFIYPWRGGEGPRDRVLLVGLDSTQSVVERAQREIAEAARLGALVRTDRATLSAVLRHLPVAVTVVEAKSGRLLFECNLDHVLRSRAFPEGGHPGAPVGWSFPDGRPVAPEEWPVAQCLRGESVRHMVVRLSRLDGGFRTFQVGGGPVRASSGQVAAAVVVWDDVTLRVVQEAERESTLARVASEREAFRGFLSYLSHQLRSPMTSILGWTRMLADGSAPPEKLARGLEVIERNAKLQIELIEGILDRAVLTGNLGLDPGSRSGSPSVPAQATQARPPRRGGGDLAGRTVLVVDDEADSRDLLRAVLQRCSARVVTAAGSDEALRELELRRIDAVVSDLAMPTPDGYDLIQRIRTQEAHADRVPAVALTGRVAEEAQKHALEAGFDLFLPKPVDPSQLVDALAKLFQRGSDPGSPPPGVEPARTLQ